MLRRHSAKNGIERKGGEAKVVSTKTFIGDQRWHFAATALTGVFMLDSNFNWQKAEAFSEGLIDTLNKAPSHWA